MTCKPPYTRQRSRTTPSQTGYFTQTNYPSGSVSNASAGTVQSGSEVMNDVVTPCYTVRKAKGQIINNPCSYVVSSLSSEGSTSGHLELTASSGYYASGHLTKYMLLSVNLESAFPQIQWGDLTASEADAKLSALANMDTTPYSFGEDTAELHETVRFLRRPLASITDLAHDFQLAKRQLMRKRYKNVKRNARRLSRDVADLWASYSFAAAPLARSVDDAIEAWFTLPDRVQLKDNRRSSSGYSVGEWSFDDDNMIQPSGGGSYRTWAVSRKAIKRYHATILYTVSNPCTGLRNDIGLRPKDFPVTMWQILPLSFLVDRLYDVSSFLKAAINLGDPKLSILAGSVSLKNEAVGKYRYKAYYHPTYPNDLSGETVVEKTFEYNRSVWSPSIHDAVPRFKPMGLVQDATKVADLVSVAIKRLT